MPTLCPSCSAEVPVANINVAKDVALCGACGGTFALSSVAHAEPARAVDTSNPPRGAWVRDDGQVFTVGATTRSPLAFLLVPFMIIWSGLSIGMIYGTQVWKGKFDPTMSLFGIPFVLGTVILGTAALMAVFGRVEVTVRAGEGRILTGVGAVGWTRRFNPSDFWSITEDFSGMSANGRSMKAIYLVGQRRIGFGALLNSERRYFMLEALRPLITGGKAR